MSDDWVRRMTWKRRFDDLVAEVEVSWTGKWFWTITNRLGDVIQSGAEASRAEAMARAEEWLQ